MEVITQPKVVSFEMPGEDYAFLLEYWKKSNFKSMSDVYRIAIKDFIAKVKTEVV